MVCLVLFLVKGVEFGCCSDNSASYPSPWIQLQCKPTYIHTHTIDDNQTLDQPTLIMQALVER